MTPQSSLPSLPEIALHRLERLDDPLLLPFLDLYESAFPQRERRPISELLAVLHAIADGRFPAKRLRAVLTGKRFAGLLIYDLHCDGTSPDAFLEFFAVIPELRGSGLGSRLLRALSEEVLAESPGANVIVLEVEAPASFPMGSDEKALAERRLIFYRRNRARVLVEGIYYEITVPHWPEPTPLLLAFLPLRNSSELPPGEYLAAAQRLLPADRFHLTGEPLRLV